jgi:membrane protein
MALPRLQRVEHRLGSAVDALYKALSHNRFTRYPWAVIQTYSRGQGALLAGSMAYFTFLSILPLLMITGSIVGTLSQGSESIRRALEDAVQQVFPGIGAEEVLGQLIESRAAFGILGLLTVAYASSGFVGALTACLNTMWEVPAGRNPFGQKLLNLTVVLLLGIVLLGSVGVTLWVAYLTRVALGSSAAPIATRIELIASPLSLFFVLLLIYRALPARKLSWRSQMRGAIIGALSIELLKRGFAFWAQNSAGVSVLPRSLVSVVLLLVWLGFFGQVILYGAAINVVRDRKRRGVSLFPPERVPTGPLSQVRPTTPEDR